MLPRKQYIFRGCLLLFPIISLPAILFVAFIWGNPADTLNRFGILLEMIGLLSALPDIVGENRLEKILTNIQSFRKTEKHIRQYLYSTKENQSRNIPTIHIILTISGNIITSLAFIGVWIYLILTPFQDMQTYLLLLVAFTVLALVASLWILLALLFSVSRRKFIPKIHELWAFFIATNHFISILGVFISASLAYVLNVIFRILIFAAKVPLQTTIARVTIPLVFIGNLLQFISTFY